MTIPQWITPAGTLLTVNGLVNTSVNVVASGNNTVYSIIAGNLPKGLTLSSSGLISGITTPNIQNLESVFVVRATDTVTNVKVDRTFKITVTRSDAPVWPTPPALVNENQVMQGIFLENEWINVTLLAHAPLVSPTNYPITYSIAPGSQELPGGIVLSPTGKLTGKISTGVGIGVKKVYNFTLVASDGVASSSQAFTFTVVSPDTFRADSTVLILGTGTSSLLDLTIPGGANSSPVQALQFLNGTDLGIINSDDNQYIPVTVYDPNPLLGPVTYELIAGSGMLNNLPQGLSLSTSTGYIYGFIPYQTAYSNRYELTIKATKNGVRDFTNAVNTFTLTVKGQMDSDIEWITNSDLGSIDTGIVSEISIMAKPTNSDYNIKYKLMGGNLPEGLTVNLAGDIQGKAIPGSAGTYAFDIEASDVYNFSAVKRSFNLIVTENIMRPSTEIYVKPFLIKEKRQAYRDFTANEFTFDPMFIYRYYDPNFGIQHEPKMVLEFGIEQINLRDYIPALSKNFYRRRFNFGDVKIAMAKDIHGKLIYEVVYVDVVDNLINSAGVSVSSEVHSNNNTYYPASIDNMRLSLQSLVLANNSEITVDEYQSPRFMRTPQDDNYKPLNYMHIIPICYALPGNGSRIVNRIKVSGFKFNLLDFEVDRLIVQHSKDNTTAKYLMLDKTHNTINTSTPQ